MGSFISKFVRCPFYREDSTQVIRCEGVEENTAINITFGSSKRHREYMEAFCCNKYKACIVCRMLYGKYQGDDNSGN